MSNIKLSSNPLGAANQLAAWPEINAKLAERSTGSASMSAEMREHLRREGERIALWGGTHLTPWHYRRGAE